MTTTHTQPQISIPQTWSDNPMPPHDPTIRWRGHVPGRQGEVGALAYGDGKVADSAAAGEAQATLIRCIAAPLVLRDSCLALPLLHLLLHNK